MSRFKQKLGNLGLVLPISEMGCEEEGALKREEKRKRKRRKKKREWGVLLPVVEASLGLVLSFCDYADIIFLSSFFCFPMWASLQRAQHDVVGAISSGGERGDFGNFKESCRWMERI